jgi:hypothetical protein
VSSNTIEPIASSYAVVSVAIGFAAGMWTRLKWRNRATAWIALWLACFAIASLMSTPLNLAFNDGHSGVPLGDAISGWLSSAHLPGVSAAYLGEAAIDLPDKLITVAVALLIAQGLPRTQPKVRGVDLDLGEALTFIFRTPSWRRKLLAAALCLVFFWLVIPGLWFIGYAVAVARQVRNGTTELPAFGGLRQKLKDGTLLVIIAIAWNIPGVILSIPAGLVTGRGTAATLVAVLAGLGSLWGLFALVAWPPIYSQYLQAGVRAAFNVPAIIERFRSALGLSIVIGALLIALSTVWVIGFLAIGVGVLFTLTYASWIGSYLVGKYAALTDPAVGVAPSLSSPPAAVPRSRES